MVKEYFSWEGEFKHVGKAVNQGKVFKWADSGTIWMKALGASACDASHPTDFELPASNTSETDGVLDLSVAPNLFCCHLQNKVFSTVLLIFGLTKPDIMISFLLVLSLMSLFVWSYKTCKRTRTAQLWFMQMSWESKPSIKLPYTDCRCQYRWVFSISPLILHPFYHAYAGLQTGLKWSSTSQPLFSSTPTSTTNTFAD